MHINILISLKKWVHNWRDRVFFVWHLCSHTQKYIDEFLSDVALLNEAWTWLSDEVRTYLVNNLILIFNPLKFYSLPARDLLCSPVDTNRTLKYSSVHWWRWWLHCYYFYEPKFVMMFLDMSIELIAAIRAILTWVTMWGGNASRKWMMCSSSPSVLVAIHLYGPNRPRSVGVTIT